MDMGFMPSFSWPTRWLCPAVADEQVVHAQLLLMNIAFMFSFTGRTVHALFHLIDTMFTPSSCSWWTWCRCPLSFDGHVHALLQLIDTMVTPSSCSWWTWFWCPLSVDGHVHALLQLFDTMVTPSFVWRPWRLCSASVDGHGVHTRLQLIKTVLFLPSFVWWTLASCPAFLGGTPEGRPGMSDVSLLSGISGLSFDSTLLSPLLFFYLVLLLFLSYLFLPASPFFWTFSRKFFNIFR